MSTPNSVVPSRYVAGHRPGGGAGRGLYRSLWHFAAGSRLLFVSGVALLVGSQLLRLVVPWLAGRAVDVLQRGGIDASGDAGLWILALFATSVATWALHGPGRVLERAVGIHVRRAVTDALFDRLANAPLKWHDRHAASDLQQRMGQTSGALEDFAQNQYVVLQGVVTFVGTLIALVAFSPATGVVAVVGYVLLVVVGLHFDRSMMKLADDENEAARRYTSGLLEFVGGIVTITALRLQGSAKRRLTGRLEALFAPIKRGIRINEAKWCFVDLMTTALTWGVVALYVWRAPQSGAAAGAGGGAILIGSVFVIYKYAEQAGSVVTAAASNFQTFARFRVNFASGDVIWNAPVRAASAGSPARDWQTIELAHVGYRHDEREGATRAATAAATRGSGIDDVRLTMRRGERIALVGPSGSGKSTLMRVMAGLYEADQGHLTVDGVAHLSIAPLASITTFVPQDADVFEADVAENIAPDGVPTGEAWNAALRASAFDAVIDEMAAGAATRVAERGVNLSGGQRQRLALARGILAAHDSSVVLLDEPTSALDPLIEAHVYRELKASFPDACVIASVHRMSALEHFDRVVLMADGAVIGSGTVDELLVSQPLFAAMMRGTAEIGCEARVAA